MRSQASSPATYRRSYPTSCNLVHGTAAVKGEGGPELGHQDGPFSPWGMEQIQRVCMAAS